MLPEAIVMPVILWQVDAADGGTEAFGAEVSATEALGAEVVGLEALGSVGFGFSFGLRFEEIVPASGFEDIAVASAAFLPLASLVCQGALPILREIRHHT